MLPFILVLVFVFALIDCQLEDEFREDLLLHPLPDGSMLSHFQFTTDRRIVENGEDDFFLFPRSLGQLVNEYKLKELKLTFTQGRWQRRRWGEPLIDSPTGAELTARFDSLLDPDLVDAHWEGVVNTLSGLLCASLQELSHKATYTQRTPAGALRSLSALLSRSSSVEQFVDSLNVDESGDGTGFSNRSSIAAYTRRGVMPGETVCTENLTPWVKLLPCQRQQGLARLLRPESLFDIDYHSQGLHILINDGEDEAGSQTDTRIELCQTMSLVTKSKAGAGDAAARRWSLFQATGNSGQSALDHLDHCPMARHTHIYALIDGGKDQAQRPQLFTENGADLDAAPQAQPVQQLLNFELPHFKRETNDVIFYHMDRKKVHDIVYEWPSEAPIPPLPPNLPSVSISRFLTGHGQSSGGLSVHLFNHDSHEALISYFDALPWQLRVYFHSMRIQLRVASGPEENALQHGHPLEFLRRRMVPAEDHGSPNLIEFTLIMPPHSSLHFHVDFDKTFMHWTEYPPDAHKAYSIGSAIVSVHSGGAFSGQTRRTGYSFGLDWVPSNPVHSKAKSRAGKQRNFSMPYNVVCLTGTVFALFFGNLYNVLTRRLSELRSEDGFVSDRPLPKMIRFIKSKISLFRAKKKE